MKRVNFNIHKGLVQEGNDVENFEKLFKKSFTNQTDRIRDSFSENISYKGH